MHARRDKALVTFFTLACTLAPFSRAQPAGGPAAAITAEDALKARRDNALPAFAKAVEDMLRQELAQKKPNADAVINLAALRTFAGPLASAKPATPKDAETLEWLLRHPTLGPMLLPALSPRDNPARVITVLTALRATFGKTVEQFPDLTVATCLVWDSPAREDQTPEQSTQAACDVFAHLTQNRKSLRFDPQALPWPVLTYLVDSRVAPDERKWALTQFKLPADAGRIYFLVRYDMQGFYSGKWKGGDRQPYTLPNILKLGGVCKDEAYFTAEVCRAYGIPATVCTGTSGAGEGFHAWVGILRGPRPLVFDFHTARYPDHGFWSGTVIDPQTGQKLADSEVAMAAEWCAATPAKRLLSQALAQSLDLLEPARRVAVCKMALEAVPGNQQAWMALVNECARPGTPAETIQEVSGVVERFAVGRYDDFAFKAFTTLIASAEPDRQLALLDKAAKFFPNRPDLLADLALRKGDAMRKASRPVDALRLYEQVLEVALAYGPIALDAMARIDAMLRQAGKMPELVDHYKVAWTHMKLPEASGYVSTTPWYIMGDRYAAALEATGDQGGAAEVRKKIRGMDLSLQGK
jgi:hypothetical protein